MFDKFKHNHVSIVQFLASNTHSLWLAPINFGRSSSTERLSVFSLYQSKTLPQQKKNMGIPDM